MWLLIKISRMDIDFILEQYKFRSVNRKNYFHLNLCLLVKKLVIII